MFNFCTEILTKHCNNGAGLNSFGCISTHPSTLSQLLRVW